MNEFKLEGGATDCISRVRFAPGSDQYLVASSWDGNVYLHNITKNDISTKYSHPSNWPVLDVSFGDNSNRLWSGCLGGHLVEYDVMSQTQNVIGRHEAVAIRCVEFSKEHSLVLTGGWDSQLKLWDSRSQRCVGTHSLDNKVYSLSVNDNTCVAAQRNRKVWIYDLRQMQYASQKRESSLKYPTRYVECMPDGQGFVLSSIEGRVAVEYFDPSPEIQKKKYAFKCHRHKLDEEEVYPVNAISFHKEFHTFASGGSDGFVNIWDGKNKKRLCQFHKYPTSISSLNFADSGTVLAIASSFQHEQRVEDLPGGEIPAPDSIYIRNTTDFDVKPK